MRDMLTRRPLETSAVSQMRAAMRPAHDAIEQTPIARQIVDSSVRRDDYVRLLVSLHLVHRELDEVLSRSQKLAPFFGTWMLRSESIERDLDALGGAQRHEPSDAAARVCARLRRLAASDSLELLGDLYVSEGSRMGSRVVAPALAKALGIRCEPGLGLDFHLEGQERSGPRLAQLRARLDESDLCAAGTDELVRGTVEAMEGLLDIYREVGGEL